jgi:hypothetical protein
MAQKLTVEDGRQSLNAHVALKAEQIRAKYGPRFSWNELLRLLEDTEFVRYPCTIAFDDKRLLDGEFACAIARGDDPAEGYTIYVHPYFSTELTKVPWLVLYHLVVVNYGDFASADDAEVFGATVLGVSRDEYYRTLCEMADSISEPQPGCGI